MTILHHSNERLVIQAGKLLNQTTVTLDRGKGVARVERATLMIPRGREELPMRDIRDIRVAEQNDPASGVERYRPVLRISDGRVLALPPSDDRTEAETTAAQMRKFIGLSH